MGNRRSCRSGLLRAVSAVLIILACCWLVIYLDSVYQRRRAERLLSDLRSFPFGSATFDEVRDLALRHGGFGVQSIPPRFPSGCTAQQCTFEVRIKHPLARLPLEGRSAELLYSALPYLAIRPWSVYSDFEIRGDRLETSSTQIAQLRRGKLRSYEGLLPITYQVWIDRHLNMDLGKNGYRVGPPDGIEGPPQEVWLAWVSHAPDAPMSRVFDLDLHCLSAAWHGCSGFRELAPSAWADYETSFKK